MTGSRAQINEPIKDEMIKTFDRSTGQQTYAVRVELMLVFECELREMRASPRFTTPLLVMEKLRSR